MPNILTEREEHGRRCTRPLTFQIGVNHCDQAEWGKVGDVRRCEHGYVMLAYEVPGTIPPYWRTLNWAFPVLYWRARKALRDA